MSDYICIWYDITKYTIRDSGMYLVSKQERLNWDIV